jgi:hypothetical protein
MSGDQRLVSHLAKPPHERDWAFMRVLLESGQVRPVIERRYTLGEGPPVTNLTGTVDQATLHSMLRRLYPLGLSLLSLIYVE